MSSRKAPGAAERADREQLFLAELPTIERVIAWVCARHGLGGAEAEDFASVVKLRLIENDYAVLGRFEGRSSLETYLHSVFELRYFDYQRERFGKWRSSAAARRLGPVALRLEVLLYRDGLTFEEACGVIHSDPDVRESCEDLLEIREQLTRRQRRPVRAAEVEPDATGGSMPDPVEDAERRALAERVAVIVSQTLATLSARDRLLLRLHFEGGLSIADVARQLGEKQKPLYPREKALLLRLREALEEAGIRDVDVRALLEDGW